MPTPLNQRLLQATPIENGFFCPDADIPKVFGIGTGRSVLQFLSLLQKVFFIGIGASSVIKRS
jgi:hypothetical protein